MRRPARPAPLTGGTLPTTASNGTDRTHGETPGAAQELRRVMLQIQVKSRATLGAMSRKAWLLVASVLVALVGVLVIGDVWWWRSDWSQFVPDALAALLTGAVISGVLLVFERSRVAHDARLAAQREWDAVRERLLRLPLGEGFRYTYERDTVAAVVCFERTTITEITGTSPLHRWRELLDDPLIPVLTTYLHEGEVARHAGGGLQTAINSVVRGQLPGSRQVLENQVIDALVSRCDSRRAAVEVDVEAAGYAERFMKDEGVQNSTTRFREALDAFESSWTTLRKQLDLARS